MTNDTNTGLISIVVSADDVKSLPLGLHIIDVREVDSITGYSKTTQYLLSVEEVDFEPFEGVVIGDFDDNEAQEDEEIEQEDEVSEPEVFEIKDDPSCTKARKEGKVIYPWQEDYCENFGDRDATLLEASVLSMSETGNLTVVFNKPIIKPPIIVTPVKNVTLATDASQRLLADDIDEFQSVAHKNYTIEEVVELSVISSFYEDGDLEIRIRDYYLTRLSEYSFDLQVEFQKSSSITMSIKEPD